jgi:hypothetical protein
LRFSGFWAGLWHIWAEASRSEVQMKMWITRGVAFCAPGILAFAASVAEARPDYVRVLNWIPGTGQGSTVNNPSTVNGQPVWQYETVQGGALGTANAWYKNSGTLMTWDPAWYVTGWGVWSNGDNHNPPILASRLVHNVAASVYNDIPLVRWRNPLGNGTSVSITGSLQVNWNGLNGLGRPDDVDVAIAKFNSSLNTTTLLFSTTVIKPLPFPSVGDSVNIPVNLTNIQMNAGDSIVLTHRGQTALAPLGAWINLYDGVTFHAVVPAPASAALLGFGGLFAARRRRR